MPEEIENIIIPVIATLLVVAIIVLAIAFFRRIFVSPFKYPYYYITFDVSKKRLPNIDDLIDEYLIEYGITPFQAHMKEVEAWKESSLNLIKDSRLKKIRTKQYEKVLDDERVFRFELVRKQTRYKQVNYSRYPYTVTIVVDTYFRNMKTIEYRYSALSIIDFACSLSKYNEKNQRKRMTKALREEIAIRDDYTCQICGKYMPDGVGLQIDHIIPIVKGGKSIPSNLQVLCSKCNGKKSNN